MSWTLAYLIASSDGIVGVVIVLTMIAAGLTILAFRFYIDEENKQTKKTLKRRAKMGCIAFTIFFIMAIIMPTQKTIVTMIMWKAGADAIHSEKAAALGNSSLDAITKAIDLANTRLDELLKEKKQEHP